MIGYYASVIDGQRRGLLLGPFDTHQEALAKVAPAERLARQVDDRAAFYGYGTARLEAATLPTGCLNKLAAVA